MKRPLTIARLVRHPAADSESLESSALVVGAAAFVVVGALAAIVFWGRDLPVAGRGSLGEFIAIGACITALIVFVFARMLLRTRVSRAPDGVRDGLEVPGAHLHWFDIVAIALAHGVIALLAWVGLSDVMARSFAGAVIFSLAAALLAGVAIAVTAYVVFLSAVHLTPMLLSLVLAAFLVMGIIASMLSATDPLWWEKNLSSLGITDDISARAFNLTLIVAGAMVTTIAHYATATIPAESEKELKGRRIVRILLVLIGLLLACVGLFPLDEMQLAHNISAVGMVIAFVVLLVGLRSWVPVVPRVFILLGYVFLAVIAALAVLYVTGRYTLTAVELIAAVLVFSWVIVFLRNTGAVRDGGVVRDTDT